MGIRFVNGYGISPHYGKWAVVLRVKGQKSLKVLSTHDTKQEAIHRRCEITGMTWRDILSG